MRKCLGFFEKDELTRKIKIESLTANNERVFSVLEKKTFPAVPVSVLEKEINKRIRFFKRRLWIARGGAEFPGFEEGWIKAMEKLLEDLK